MGCMGSPKSGSSDNYILAEFDVKEETNDEVCLTGMLVDGQKEIPMEVKVNGEIVTKPKEYNLEKGHLYKAEYTFPYPLTDAKNLFYYCYFSKVDLSHFQTKNLKNMECAFSCNEIESISFSGLSFSNVINMKGMLSGCFKLKIVDLSNVKIKVNDIESLFTGCSSLENVNLSSLDTENVTSMANLFSGCEVLMYLISILKRLLIWRVCFVIAKN